MNVQIFGTKKCNDTKKAERFFKERGIKFQFIDMKEKGMSKGEFNSVAQANGGLILFVALRPHLDVLRPAADAPEATANHAMSHAADQQKEGQTR